MIPTYLIQPSINKLASRLSFQWQEELRNTLATTYQKNPKKKKYTGYQKL
jgi:hypothetical protein